MGRLSTLTHAFPALLLAVAMLSATSNCRAAPLDSSVIRLFPKDTGNFGYADLATARGLPWFPQFEAQVVPVPLFGVEQLLESIEMRQTSPIDEVVWGDVNSGANSSDQGSENGGGADAKPSGVPSPAGGQPVVVAIGNFDANAIQSFVESKKIAGVAVGNYSLYPAGTGSGRSDVFFAVIDSQTILLGNLAPLERVLRVRDGQEDNLLQNESMMSLIDQQNGDGIFWAVLDGSSAGRAIQELVPQAANFSQSRDLMAKVSNVLIGVKAPYHIELSVELASDSPKDATLMSLLLQTGVLVRRYQMKNLNDDAVDNLFDALRISPDGNLVDISLELSNEQVTDLIEHNLFAIGL